MYFEIIGSSSGADEENSTPTFLQIIKKRYLKNGSEKIMIQIVDVSQ